MEREVAETPNGEAVYIDRAAAERGSEGPFFVVFDETGESRYGYFCGNCETFDIAMDTMGRIVCNQCPNVRKPDEWDAAHE